MENIPDTSVHKIIFLDMDDVIATRNTIIDSRYAITPSCQDALGTILSATGGDIVISSSWRGIDLDTTRQRFQNEGFAYCDKIIGATTRVANGIVGFRVPGFVVPRGAEIKHWLKENIAYNKRERYGYRYVILDDEVGDMLLEQKEYIIHCDELVGLTLEDARRAITILNRN